MTDEMPIIAKIVFACLAGGAGYWFWRSANEWGVKGVIPAIWNEGNNVPVKAGDKGFSAFLVWQKLMSALLWFFCALCVASIVLSDVLGLF